MNNIARQFGNAMRTLNEFTIREIFASLGQKTDTPGELIIWFKDGTYITNRWFRTGDTLDSEMKALCVRTHIETL